LHEESIFISIGHREFQIPRDLLTDPRNSPNYFSLGFALFFSRPDELFPGLDRGGLIRPPSILPPSVPGRSADTFAELLRLLRGYEVRVRDEAHRRDLLRDARYFQFKGLEQRLLPHRVAFNSLRGCVEVVIRLENVQKSGISILYEGEQQQQQQQQQQQEQEQPSSSDKRGAARVTYARPYTDDAPSDLILEIGNQSSRIHFRPQQQQQQQQQQQHTTATAAAAAAGPRLEFFRDTKTRIAKLLQVIATKLNLAPTTQPLGLPMASDGAASQPATPGNTPLGQDLVRVVLGPDASITLDGRDYTPPTPPGPVPQTIPAPVHVSSLPCDVSSDLSSHYGDGHAAAATADQQPQPARKRKRPDGDGSGSDTPDGHAWTVMTGQWRLRILAAGGANTPPECVFVAVKIDAVSGERARNRASPFLS
ncbi:hypothetical protein E4U41_007337, partial [Claviceps citrina]